jgi:diacylglycerol O-acyltransferase
MVPVSVRTDDGTGIGNRVSSIFVDLPIGPISARKRLRVIREATEHLKESHYAVGAEFLMNIGMWAPPTIHAMAARLATRTRVINLVVSNVPGPRDPLSIADARIVALYSMGPILEGIGLNVTVWSYVDSMNFGVVSCPELAPDLWSLTDGLADELAKLVKRSGAGAA